MSQARLLSGKLALVTGSTSGIGLGIAKCLAAAGSNIILNGFGDANEIASNISAIKDQHEVEVRHVSADLSDPSDIQKMMANVGPNLDILVNNAGIQHVCGVEHFPEDKWDLIISVNLSAAFRTTKLALPKMKERGYGRIINIASVHGLVGSSGKAAYVAAKHGIIGLTKVVGLEMAGTGVTCNTICPGWVRTPLVEKQIHDHANGAGITYDEAVVSLLASKQPSKQFVTPEELGATVAFLCSDAAKQMTGTSVVVDGGWTAQ
eukprot:Colp12_sorted_trinity150504_noHs@18877